MLGDKIESVDLKIGTTEELLENKLSSEQRFIIETMHILIERFKEYLRGPGSNIRPNEYIDMVLRLMSNTAINTLVPFVRGGPKENHEFVMREASELLSQMIMAGYRSLEEAENSHTETAH